jgi:two-component system, cell cycle sensor histidine kinase and response regulator CckA
MGHNDRGDGTQAPDSSEANVQRSTVDAQVALLRGSPVAIAVTSEHDDRIIEVNPAFERLFKVTSEEVMGQSLLTMFGESSALARLLTLVRSHGHVRDLEGRALTKQGDALTLSVSAERCTLAQTSCIVTFLQDITARRTLEEALRESEDKFAKVFRVAPYSISIADLERDRYMDVNEGFERLFGCRREHVVGRPVGDLALWAFPEERQKYIDTLRRDGVVREMPIHGRRTDGEILVGEASGLIIKIADRRCLITFARDLTDQLKAQRAAREIEMQLREAQKLEALGVLAGGIAHDFNNILGAIMAFTELIELDLDDPESLQSNLEMLRQANQRAKELVQQILLFSRRKKHERNPVRISAAVREALRLLRSTLPPTIEIFDQIDPEAPIILADPSQIHQVVMNLATNAVHAMGDKQGRLTVQLKAVTISEESAQRRPDLRPGPNVLLSISDTGSGMDEQTRSRIFEPFFTTKQPGEGTGLGLAVVHGIAREHEAAIVVLSEVGVGTTFELYFPEHPAELSDDKALSVSLVRGRGESVLVIDDEPALRYAVARLLERLGYVATTSEGPEDALTRLAQDRGAFDVILSDLSMAKMNGVELGLHILKDDPGARVVIMSGFSPNWNAESLREIGICQLLTKPITALELSRTIRAALDEPQPQAFKERISRRSDL